MSGYGRLGLPVFRVAQPVQGVRTESDFFMDRQRRRALPKPGLGFMQKLGPCRVQFKQDLGFPQHDGQARRGLRLFVGDRDAEVTDINDPGEHPNHLVAIVLSQD